MTNYDCKWKNTSTSYTYNSWRSMRNRCLFDNANSKHYKMKGIGICNEWVDNYDKFYEDMGERPIGTTIDRINPTLGYSKDNCRWATHSEQQNNKPNLTSIMFEGKSYTIGELVDLLDLTKQERAKVYKRHSAYGATTFDELFYTGNLLQKRTAERNNLCLVCDRTESTKWRKDGKLCNTCYHQGLRWSKKENKNIEEYPKWKTINWQ